MIWFLVSLGISYAIVQPHSFVGFLGTILFSFVIDIIAVVLLGRR